MGSLRDFQFATPLGRSSRDRISLSPDGLCGVIGAGLAGGREIDCPMSALYEICAILPSYVAQVLNRAGR